MNKKDHKILIVDDEKDVREILLFNLSQEGYTVHTAEDGEKALKIIEKEKPKLIILDVMMPIMDGYETCKKIRTLPDNKDTIIVFLSARNEDYSQITGFEAGGDDYITKPINPKVLLSRIKALLKRYKNIINEDEIITFGEYRIDTTEYVVYKKNEPLTLPKKQFEILRLLASKPNHVFTREKIFEKIWGDDVIVGSRTIDVHVRKIREKTGIENIRTIKGIGYKLKV